MNNSKIFSLMLSGVLMFGLHATTQAAPVEEGAGAGEGGGAGAAADPYAYREEPLPEVGEADASIREKAINDALAVGGFDVSNNLRYQAKLAAASERNKKSMLALHEQHRSTEENREFRFALGTGAYAAKDGKLFYVKGKQPKYGHKAFPFAVLSKRSVGNPYPEEKTIAYSTPAEGLDVLTTKDFGHNELCMKSKFAKDERGRIIKDGRGRNVMAVPDAAKANRCVEMIDTLLTDVNAAFENLNDHARVKKAFVDYHTIEQDCAGVFANEDCNTRKSGEPTYQRIHMLKRNFRSLIWAYNYFLHEAERRSVGPVEGDPAIDE